MKRLIQNAVSAAAGYVVKNPLNMARLARHAIGFRIAIPLDAVRWFIKQIPVGGMVPTGITVEARPPAINIGATVDIMGTKARASASIGFSELHMNGGEARMKVRLTDIDLNVIDNPNHPLMQMIKSGAVDLKQPGNLLNFLPNKPPIITEAKDDTITIDLLQAPGLGDNPGVRKLLRTVTPVLDLKAIRTQNDMLIVALRPKPMGISELISEIRN